jgi:hypothetical protein
MPRKPKSTKPAVAKKEPWVEWVKAIRWSPHFSSDAHALYEKSASPQDEEEFLVEGAPEFVAFLSGRAFRIKFGPKPLVPEWSVDGGCAPRAARLGLYKDDRTLQAEWEEGWAAEDARLKGRSQP